LPLLHQEKFEDTKGVIRSLELKDKILVTVMQSVTNVPRFQLKWIFTGSKTCCTILRPFRFAMAAILNPKLPPKYKNPPIWAKFGTTRYRHESQKLGSDYFLLC
jgi:hypothetical protein